MNYSWDVFKKEHLRYAWLSGRYTEEQLKEKYWDEYIQFCINHNLKNEIK